ncbi:MAG: NUDIX hydrolase [Patescibacteria group bacterium]
MNNPVVIGVHNPSIEYKDRLTVKALILNDKDEVLIINDGLLPGGGVEENEDSLDALHRETMEELGINIGDTKELGAVVQFRDFIKRKYIINAYTAQYLNNSGIASPQNEREAAFVYNWYTIPDAMLLLDSSISHMYEGAVELDGANQGKLYNLKTTRAFLNMLAKSSKLVQ